MPSYGVRVGDHAELHRTVTAADTADSMGSGDVPVLATPRLLAWLEAATVAASAALPPGKTSVGVRVEVDHLQASAVGTELVCTARVEDSDGRVIGFAVTATDRGRVVARGRVLRAVVERDRFLRRVAGT